MKMITFVLWSILLTSGTALALPVPPPPPGPAITVNDSLAETDDRQLKFSSLNTGISLSGVIRIKNDGNVDLRINGIALNDPLAPPFSIEEDTCSYQSIAPLSSCRITIGFSPVSSGSFSDTFDISSNAADAYPLTVSVNGTGLPSGNLPPSMPQLLYPEDGQTGSGPTVRFAWERAADPDLDSVSYSLYVSEDPDFINSSPFLLTSAKKRFDYASTGAEFILFSVILAGGFRSKKGLGLLAGALLFAAVLSFSCGSSGGSNDVSNVKPPDNEASMEVSGLAAGATYYWKVMADDGNGGVVESKKRFFTTQ